MTCEFIFLLRFHRASFPIYFTNEDLGHRGSGGENAQFVF